MAHVLVGGGEGVELDAGDALMQVIEIEADGADEAEEGCLCLASDEHQGSVLLLGLVGGQLGRDRVHEAVHDGTNILRLGLGGGEEGQDASCKDMQMPVSSSLHS
eukprot:TRINITY_DN11452_c0_g1_i1.p1 TRINITY_DN11452_c0_g1~~TRINITY_DN11452_c0_g1_i1.p1  ORF type:complete len:105 (-),score=14.72 TRINITY_DN11452_c0_g1_i1:224-538(-)